MSPILTRFRCRPAAVLTAIALWGLAAAAVPAVAQEPAKYHSYAEMSALLQTMAGAHKDIARLVSIGKTAGGRDIWLVEVANPAGVPVAERPALLVAANFEADHLIGSEIALAVIDGLLKGYPANADIKARLDGSVIYVIPRMNPDGAEGFFGPAKLGRRTNLASRDEDNDGRTDEDGPEDLNKDGLVTLMRVKASDGEYIVDPEEPRLMKKADPKKGRPAPTRSSGRAATRIRTASSARTRPAARTSTATSCTNIPTISRTPGRTWPARRNRRPSWPGRLPTAT